MISVAEATARLLAFVEPLGSERVPLRRANGRVTAAQALARHAQPPFDASSMDGYAVAGGEPSLGSLFAVVGTAAAGAPFDGRVGPGEAARILTGAAMPVGAGRVLIQEDVTVEGDAIRVATAPGAVTHVRQAGGDFARGFALSVGTRLGSRSVALLAAMGHGDVEVVRRPEVAIIMTGDELRAPCETLGPGEVVGSNGYGLAAMLEDAGAEARLLPIARDDAGSLALAFDLARGADLVVTIGGASVGDRDVVATSAAGIGLETAFHRVAMRPGKPLIAGRLGDAALVGLPGNPVSAMVCGVVFVLPMVRRMLGLHPAVPTRQMPTATALPANDGPRAHYMRAAVEDGRVRVAERQDSSLLSLLAAADVLVVRAPGAGPVEAGCGVAVVPLPA